MDETDVHMSRLTWQSRYQQLFYVRMTVWWILVTLVFITFNHSPSVIYALWFNVATTLPLTIIATFRISSVKQPFQPARGWVVFAFVAEIVALAANVVQLILRVYVDFVQCNRRMRELATATPAPTTLSPSPTPIHHGGHHNVSDPTTCSRYPERSIAVSLVIITAFLCIMHAYAFFTVLFFWIRLRAEKRLNYRPRSSVNTPSRQDAKAYDPAATDSDLESGRGPFVASTSSASSRAQRKTSSQPDISTSERGSQMTAAEESVARRKALLGAR